MSAPITIESVLIDRAAAIYRKYGVKKDFDKFIAQAFIAIREDLMSHPALAEELANDSAAQSYYVMQILLSL